MKAQANCIMHAGHPRHRATCSFYRGVSVVLIEMHTIPCLAREFLRGRLNQDSLQPSSPSYMLVGATYRLMEAILPPFYFREHFVVAWLGARTHGENLHWYCNKAMNNMTDEDHLATRLSEINLCHPASESFTQGRCSSVARQRQDSVLEHQTHSASSNGKILADDPDLKLQSIGGKWKLTIDDYDDPRTRSFQIDVIFYNSRKAIGLLHSADNESLQIAVSGYQSVQETAYQRSNSKTTDKSLAIMNHLGVGFRSKSWASHVEPQLLTRIWSDPDAGSRTYTMFINKEICVSCKPVLEAAALELRTRIDVLRSIDAQSKSIEVVRFHPSGKTESKLQR